MDESRVVRAGGAVWEEVEGADVVGVIVGGKGAIVAAGELAGGDLEGADERKGVVSFGVAVLSGRQGGAGGGVGGSGDCGGERGSGQEEKKAEVVSVQEGGILPWWRHSCWLSWGSRPGSWRRIEDARPCAVCLYC